MTDAMLQWQAVLQGTVTGLVGATLIALFTLMQNRLREQLLKRQIRKDLNNLSAGHNLEGVTTSVRNRTGHEMTVRKITFVMNGTHVVLLATGDLQSSYKQKARRFSRAERRLLKAGQPIRGEAEMQFGSWKVARERTGFISLSPYTSAGFLLPAQFIGESDNPFNGARVVLEYTTRNNEKRILDHRIKPERLEHIRKTLDFFREQMRNGKLNESRRQFGLSTFNYKHAPTSKRPPDPTPPPPASA